MITNIGGCVDKVALGVEMRLCEYTEWFEEVEELGI